MYVKKCIKAITYTHDIVSNCLHCKAHNKINKNKSFCCDISSDIIDGTISRLNFNTISIFFPSRSPSAVIALTLYAFNLSSVVCVSYFKLFNEIDLHPLKRFDGTVFVSLYDIAYGSFISSE